MVKATLQGPAPRLRAVISSRGSTSPMATIIALTSSGKETTAAASAAATQVNTTSIPRSWWTATPMGPSRPRSRSRKKPIATGGSASGRETSMSIRTRPRTLLLARSQLTARPMGRLIAVATRAMRKVSATSARSTNPVHSSPFFASRELGPCRRPVAPCPGGIRLSRTPHAVPRPAKGPQLASPLLWRATRRAQTRACGRLREQRCSAGSRETLPRSLCCGTS